MKKSKREELVKKLNEAQKKLSDIQAEEAKIENDLREYDKESLIKATITVNITVEEAIRRIMGDDKIIPTTTQTIPKNSEIPQGGQITNVTKP